MSLATRIAQEFNTLRSTISSHLSGSAANKLLAGTESITNLASTLVHSSTLYTGTGATLNVNTGIESKDINWYSGKSYALGDLAFTRAGTGVTAGAFTLWRCTTAHTSGTTVGTNTLGDSQWTAVQDGEVYSWPSIDVHIKSRSNLVHNYLFDTLRGVNNTIYTSITDAELLGTNRLVAFTDIGFTIGSDIGCNTSGATYVAWTKAYNKITINTTKHGKRVLEAFDDKTNRFMALYQGSGVAGHEIPHSIGDVPVLGTWKNLSISSNWITQYILDGSGKYLHNNGNNALAISAEVNTVATQYSITLDITPTQNADNQLYIMYGEASSESCKIGTYVGTGASVSVDGYFNANNVTYNTTASTQYLYKVYLGNDKRAVFADTKSLNTLGHWFRFDKVRGEDKPLLLNTIYKENDVNGDTIDDGAIDYTSNMSTQIGSYEYLPSDTSNIQLTNAAHGFTNGVDANGVVQQVETVNGIITIDPSYPLQQGTNYVYKVKDIANYRATKYEPYYGKSRQSFNGHFFDIWDKKMYDNSGITDLVTNGTFDIDVSGWIAFGTSTITWDNGKLKLTANANGEYSYQNIIGLSAYIGQKIKISLNTINGTAGSRITIKSGSTFVVSDLDTTINDRAYEFNILGDIEIRLQSYGIGTTYFDNIHMWLSSEKGTQVDVSYLKSPIEADANGIPVQVIDANDITHFDEVVAKSKVRTDTITDSAGTGAPTAPYGLIGVDASAIFNGSADSNITVTVGSGGNYSTINAALEYLSKFYPLYKSGGVTATINLLPGFVMGEQVLVRGVDLGWVTIVGVDATTTITHTTLTTDFTTSDYGFASYPAFGVSKGGTLPRIGQLFVFSASGVGGNKHGIMSIGSGSSAEILLGSGVNSAGAYGIYATRCATINASSASANSAGTYGIYAEDSSTINASGSSASNAGVYGIYATRCATIDAHGASANSAGTYGIVATRGSRINASSAGIQNQTTGTACIAVSDGSHIEATGIVTTGSTVTILSQTANTLTGNGIIYQ